MAASYPIVEIEWLDAASYFRWQDPATDFQLVECMTAGYLLAEHKDRYVVTIGVNAANGDVANVLVIPKRLVQNFTTIRQAATPR